MARATLDPPSLLGPRRTWRLDDLRQFAEVDKLEEIF